MDAEEILDTFYRQDHLHAAETAGRVPFSFPNRFRGLQGDSDLVDAYSGKVVLEACKN